MFATRWQGLDPLTREEWDEEDVLDMRQILAGEHRYWLRHRNDKGDGINAKTGIPLE